MNHSGIYKSFSTTNSEISHACRVVWDVLEQLWLNKVTSRTSNWIE